MKLTANTLEYIKNTLRFKEPEVNIYFDKWCNQINMSFFGDREKPINTAIYIVREGEEIHNARLIQTFTIEPLKAFEKDFKLRDEETLVIANETIDNPKVIEDSYFVDENGHLYDHVKTQE